MQYPAASALKSAGVWPEPGMITEDVGMVGSLSQMMPRTWTADLQLASASLGQLNYVTCAKKSMSSRIRPLLLASSATMLKQHPGGAHAFNRMSQQLLVDAPDNARQSSHACIKCIDHIRSGSKVFLWAPYCQQSITQQSRTVVTIALQQQQQQQQTKSVCVYAHGAASHQTACR